MVDDRSLLRLMQVISSGDSGTAARLLQATPELASAQLSRGGTRANAEDFFLRECYLQLYTGDAALHVAAATYDTALARKLVAAGADIRARNRRGGEPLHSAVNGGPVRSDWDPQRQTEMVTYLIEVGADPDAVAAAVASRRKPRPNKPRSFEFSPTPPLDRTTGLSHADRLRDGGTATTFGRPALTGTGRGRRW